jgi:predicted Zn-dependent peptidase
MEYGEGKYYDEEMSDIIADAAEREVNETLAEIQAEIDAQEDWLVEQAELRAREQAWNTNGQEC